ncbi:MAG: 50S ribosomal protein L33 [Patescibacteria group bacterium]|nr:50S ribosomal protein L33 [Patescibacteria group bacterium]MCL5261938.1 50S ribosomal protein L33 [Patescibacteria group bacterium]
MAKAKSKFSENLIRLKCGVCGNINYFTRKNKKLVERKVTLQKYCGHCRKRTEHKETKR